MYLDPVKLESGAYCCPQSTYVEGFFEISDELTAILVENKGFVIITVDANVVTAVEPDMEALMAWEEYQASIHQPCEPYSPCNGNGNLVAACPDCGVPLLSSIPISQVGRVQTGSYVGTGASGSDNYMELVFDFVPKLIIINNNTGGSINNSTQAIWLYGQEAYRWQESTSFDALTRITWAGNTVSWYGNDETAHLNLRGNEYNYIAIG